MNFVMEHEYQRRKAELLEVIGESAEPAPPQLSPVEPEPVPWEISLPQFPETYEPEPAPPPPAPPSPPPAPPVPMPAPTVRPYIPDPLPYQRYEPYEPYEPDETSSYIPGDESPADEHERKLPVENIGWHLRMDQARRESDVSYSSYASGRIHVIQKQRRGTFETTLDAGLTLAQVLEQLKQKRFLVRSLVCARADPCRYVAVCCAVCTQCQRATSDRAVTVTLMRENCSMRQRFEMQAMSLWRVSTCLRRCGIMLHVNGITLVMVLWSLAQRQINLQLESSNHAKARLVPRPQTASGTMAMKHTRGAFSKHANLS